MKEIKAFIKPFMLDHVKSALKDLNISGMSVTEVKGFGRDKDESTPGQFQSEFVDFVPKVKLEILCKDEDVEKIMDCIYQYAHTGLKGDGNIFVEDVIKVKSIRTGKENDEVI